MVIMLSLLAIWLLFVLLVPKRAVNSLAERLRATAQGHRVYVFAPPAELGRGFAMSGLGEGVRLIQVGLPVYLLCLWAEARGRRRRKRTRPCGGNMSCRRWPGAANGRQRFSQGVRTRAGLLP